MSSASGKSTRCSTPAFAVLVSGASWACTAAGSATGMSTDGTMFEVISEDSIASPSSAAVSGSSWTTGSSCASVDSATSESESSSAISSTGSEASVKKGCLPLSLRTISFTSAGGIDCVKSMYRSPARMSLAASAMRIVGRNLVVSNCSINPH